MTDTESTEPAARSGPTLAGLARELDVSMSRAAALVTQAGEPLHQVWYGTEVIAPEIADLARRLHRDTDPERPLFGVTLGALARELDVAPEWLDGYVSSLLEEGRLVVWADRGVLSAAAADEIRTLVRAERVPVTDQERISRLYAVGGRVEALLNAGGNFWIEAKEVDGGDTWRADVSDKVTGAWFTLTVQDSGNGTAAEQAPAALPQGITVRDLAQELHQPVSTTAAQARAYSEATGRDPYQERVTWIGDWVLTPQAAQWIRRPLRESEPSPAQLPVSGPCSVPGQPREAAQAASPDPEDVASLLIRQDMRNADPVESRGATDQKIMAWAVRTAGHRFDPHTLWDYDLVTDAEHVHRCLDHRHTGPNTLGPVRRGQ